MTAWTYGVTKMGHFLHVVSRTGPNALCGAHVTRTVGPEGIKHYTKCMKCSSLRANYTGSQVW